MAKEEKKIEEIEVVASVVEEKTKHKVKKEFTLDKLYKVGSIIELPNGKTKTVLISNKFI